jgi:hypothetical protein
MAIIDLGAIEQILKEQNLYSDHLISTGESAIQALTMKVEATRWCLGIATEELQYHSTTSNGTIINKFNAYDADSPETENANLQPNYQPGAPNQHGFVQLPHAGEGWIANGGSPSSQQWGQPRVIQALVAIAKEWKRRGYGSLVYGDISLQYGGPFPPHISHQFGVDIDIRPIGINDSHVNNVTTVNSRHYDRTRTRELIQLIQNNGIIPVSKDSKTGVWNIGFQDPILISEGLTVNWRGHEDHFHVRFVR